MTAAKKRAPTYVARIEVAEVEKAIGIPAEEWKGRCFEIATKMVEAGVVEGTPVYGHWVGPISRYSHFESRRNTGFTNHGWVVVNEEEQLVVDPTRWVFEARKPYIFIGKPEVECPDFQSEDPLDPVCSHCGHVEEEHKSGFFSPCMVCAWPYDEGGNKLKEQLKREVPSFKEKGSVKEEYAFDKHLSPAGKKKLASLLGAEATKRPKGKLSWVQLMWLANLPYEDFSDMAAEFYAALAAVGQGGLIPMDNREKARRGRA